MCVIIVKPAGKNLPSKDILIAAYRANPHGCGFASPTRHYKGLSFNQFMREISRVPVCEPCIIHFRLATHGSVSPSNCHPFKCGNLWFAHNGILNIAPLDDMTDSETALRQIIEPAVDFYGYGSVLADSVINDIRGYSKFAMMQDGEVRLYGDFIERDGLMYSNLHFAHKLASIGRHGVERMFSFLS